MNQKTRVICTLPTPYPEIRVEAKNGNYARMLSLAYAGPDGELGTILSYIYGKTVSMDKKPDMLSDVLECVSITEMRHLEILAKLIYLLGEEPRFCGSNRRMFFNTSSLTYSDDPTRIIKNAMDGESRAIKLYKELSRVIDDAYIKKILERFVLDEEHHLKIFSELLQPQK